ncbi:1-acyl-sn-glycerol-3-phosphate acyltransferase [Algoriphagus sp.]|uniref:1-acyl-sn-glycerol-3-phosphate acyltransferase n=1 Tax=Algoriphagus sp. TaxID=1872435 RepID=UPI00391D61D8
MSKKFIDIEKAIHSKNPKILKWMPGFTLKYIKNVTHEKWMNGIMEKIHHLQGMDFVNALTAEFELDVELLGKENIPLSGGFILSANHPLGGIDGVALMFAIGKIRPDIRFLVNDLLMSFDNFQPIFVPVNTLGKNSVNASLRIEETYANKHPVLIFPAGLVSRKQEGVIKDLSWKKSFISKAKKYQLDVLPCHIEGRNSEFFYNLANWRKRIGIKANVEMFWLVDEMYKQRGKKVVIKVGSPVSYQYFNSEKNDAQWAEYMKDLVYKLGESNG